MTNSSSTSSISLRAPQPDDRAQVLELLEATRVFRAEEVLVALEVFDDCAARPGYRGAVAARGERVVGLCIWGATPMTEGTFDLYWLATHPDAYGTGAASALLERAVADVGASGGRLLLVETESTEAYARARRFYEREGFAEAACLRDYYRPGADKWIGELRLEELKR